MNISNISFPNSIHSLAKESILSALNIGDSIKAQVVEILPESVLLRLTDGNIIQAGSLSPLKLENGQNIVLTVHEKNDSQIFVKLSSGLSSKVIESNDSMDYKELLLSMNVKSNKTNMEILQNLIRYHIPVTKEQINNISTLLGKFAPITPDKMVFMLSNNMDINENNIQLLNRIIDRNANIEGELLHISKLLDESLSLNNDDTMVEGNKETLEALKSNFEKLFIKVEQLKYLHESMKPEILKSLAELSQIIKNIKNIGAKQETLNTQELISNLNQLEDKLSFMKQITNHFIYLQIPIRINQKNTSAELYIMRDKRKKKTIDPTNTTIFLSLSTQNLGLLEILIKVNKKTIECDFAMDSFENLDFVKKNITPLYALLEAKGYKLIRVHYKQQEEKTNLLDMVQVLESENTNYSFDIKV